jgi:hypothetical protein
MVNMLLYLVMRFLEQHNEQHSNNILKLKGRGFEDEFSSWFYVSLRIETWI